MKWMLTDVVNRPKKLLYLTLLVTTIGALLFFYFQPLCEPCLTIDDCPPCISQLQYNIIYIVVTINVFALARLIYLKLKD